MDSGEFGCLPNQAKIASTMAGVGHGRAGRQIPPGGIAGAVLVVYADLCPDSMRNASAHRGCAEAFISSYLQAVTGGSALPSDFCALYATQNLVNVRRRCSVGTEPFHCVLTDSTFTFVSV